MNMASGRSDQAFELVPQRNVKGDIVFHESQGDAIRPAQRALYGKNRPTKERIHWMFSPDRDERVSSLLRWVGAMSPGLAAMGLQKFLHEGQRGALIANADFRIGAHGYPSQPAFDWISIDALQPTLDRIFQESVVCYNPAFQVVVFVFLLSRSGNSMAVWRKKVPIPDNLRRANEEHIQRVMQTLDPKYRVYVDELSSPQLLDAPLPPPPEKKKKKGFWKRLFGL